MMARWMLDTPVSPVRDRMRSRLAQHQEIARAGRLNTVERLRWLFDDAPDLPEKVTPAQASQATQLFAELYHHAVPFSRKALGRLWQRCERDPKQQQACFTARMNLKQKLGDLGE
jgi:hypothetical protein